MNESRARSEISVKARLYIVFGVAASIASCSVEQIENNDSSVRRMRLNDLIEVRGPEDGYTVMVEDGCVFFTGHGIVIADCSNEGAVVPIVFSDDLSQSDREFLTDSALLYFSETKELLPVSFCGTFILHEGGGYRQLAIESFWLRSNSGSNGLIRGSASCSAGSIESGQN